MGPELVQRELWGVLSRNHLPHYLGFLENVGPQKQPEKGRGRTCHFTKPLCCPI